MPDKVHAARVPSSAKTVTRSATAAGIFYTVPAGKTLVILSMWVAAAYGAGGGQAGIQVTGEDNGLGVRSVQINVAANSHKQLQVDDLEIRCKSATVITAQSTGTVVALAYGLAGYLENA